MFVSRRLPTALKHPVCITKWLPWLHKWWFQNNLLQNIVHCSISQVAALVVSCLFVTSEFDIDFTENTPCLSAHKNSRSHTRLNLRNLQCALSYLWFYVRLANYTIVLLAVLSVLIVLVHT